MLKDLYWQKILNKQVALLVSDYFLNEVINVIIRLNSFASRIYLE